MEEYRDIEGYEGLYSVSDHGNVYSHKTNKVLKPKSNKINRKRVGLSKPGIIENKRISQLVAMAFLGHVPNGITIVVDHIDNNPANDHLSNLQLISTRLNTSKDKVKKNGLPTGVYQRKNRFHTRICINGIRVTLGTFDTAEEASNAYQNALANIEQ